MPINWRQSGGKLEGKWLRPLLVFNATTRSPLRQLSSTAGWRDDFQTHIYCVNIKCQKPYSSKHKITIASSVFLFWANALLACPVPVPPMSHNALHMFHLTALPPLHLKYDMCSTRHWPNQLPPKYTFKKHTFKWKNGSKAVWESESVTDLPTYLPCLPTDRGMC